MRLFRLVIPILAGLVLAVGTLTVFARSQPAPASPPAPFAIETDLTWAAGPEGTNGPENMHADASGRLWISQDSDGAAYVRVYDPATRAYTDYTGLVSPNDAQLGPDGNAWWSLDDPSAGLARLDLASGTVTTWSVPSSGGAGLAFDSNHKLWGADSTSIFSFAPNSHQLCIQALPNGNLGNSFMTEQNGALWMGLDDTITPGLARITPTTNAYTFWPTNVSGFQASPTRASFAPGGVIWFSDEVSGTLGRLETGANRVTLFNPPGGLSPQMVDYYQGILWFTAASDVDGAGGTIGRLDPATAASTTPVVVTPTTTVLSLGCSDAGPGVTFTAGIRTGVSVFRPLALTTAVDAQGIAYGTPISSQPAALLTLGSNLWLTDQGRNSLVEFAISPTSLYLPLTRK